jgi:hypothetical protein
MGKSRNSASVTLMARFTMDGGRQAVMNHVPISDGFPLSFEVE